MFSKKVGGLRNDLGSMTRPQAIAVCICIYVYVYLYIYILIYLYIYIINLLFVFYPKGRSPLDLSHPEELPPPGPLHLGGWPPNPCIPGSGGWASASVPLISSLALSSPLHLRLPSASLFSLSLRSLTSFPSLVPPLPPRLSLPRSLRLPASLSPSRSPLSSPPAPLSLLSISSPSSSLFALPAPLPFFFPPLPLPVSLSLPRGQRLYHHSHRATLASDRSAV